MSITSTGQSAVSSAISQVAAALLSKDKIPITNLQNQRTTLTQQSTVLGTLKTKLAALEATLGNLAGTGTLSPFTAKTVSSSDPATLTAAATSSAAVGTLAITVQQLARRAVHVTDVLANTATTLSDGGAGTFSFSLAVGGTTKDVSVTVNAGDTNQTVLDNVAAAITTAMAGKASAVRVQTETGKSRLTIASVDTGTSNKITFTDTAGLLARLGIVHGSPTAATDTTGGYLSDDLGNHELDARFLVDGLTYYRESNTVSDLVGGVTLSLKGVSTNAVSVQTQPDADTAMNAIKDFIAKYNDVLDTLTQNTAVDPTAGTRGPLALDPIYSTLAGNLRLHAATVVSSQTAGTANNLAALGITSARDGKLSIGDETALRKTFGDNPGAFANLFNATDGVGSVLKAFVDGYSRATGAITRSQNAITARVSSIDAQIKRRQDALAKRQAALEDQLARQQAVLDQLNNQVSQMNTIIGTAQSGSL
jgi:flagellar hook-associated protein 2